MKRAIPLLAAALAALLAAPRALGDYTPVEWIKASGSQWIFTGYTPAADDRVEMKAMLAADNASQTFWCSRGTTTTTNTFTAFFLYVSGQSNRKVRFDYGGKSPASDFSSAALAKSVVYVLSADGATKACKVTRASDSAVVATATMTEATPLDPASPFSLLASHTQGAALTASTAQNQMANFGSYTLYYFRVYGADGSLKRNFIPARDDAAASGSLAQYGLYETVGGTFHPGLGTGAFTAGGVSPDYRFNAATGRMEVRLSVTFDSREGGVALNGAPIDSGEAVWLAAGASATLVATPRAGGTFQYWGGDAPASEALSNPLTLPCDLPLTLLARLGNPRVPAGYVPLEYIESTGTQWIDTKTVAQGANTSVEMDVTATTTPSDTTFFGYAWNSNQYLLLLRGGNILFYGPGTSVAPYVANHDYRFSVTNGTVTVIDETTSTTNSKALTDTYAGTATLRIFADSSAKHQGSFRLRRMKIWKNGVLVRDFVPCYRSDAGGVATPGLYDLAGDYVDPADGFFANKGSGAFKMGAPLGNEIVIRGLPEAYGAPESTVFDGYGRAYLAGGTEFRATVPNAEQTANGGHTRFTPAGWTLSVTHLDGTSETLRSTAATKTVCAYTPSDGDLATLTWQWESQSQLTVTADAGLAVTAPEWPSYGEQVRVTVGNDGAEFIAWEGDIPPLDTFSTNFLITVTGPTALHARKADAVLHVAPEAAGLADGSSWDNAFGNIQTALTVRAASPAGTLIRVAAGTYFVTNAISATQATNVVIRGGYTGVGLARGGETVVARDTAYSTLIFSLTKSRVLFDSLTVSNGFRAVAADSYGQGMALLGASVSAVRDCRFVLNGNGNNRSDKNLYGSAIGAQNGALAIENCVFDRNSIHDGGATNVKPLGGAVGAVGATVRVRGSAFDRNYTQTVHARLHGGGALGFSGCPSVEIDHCTFTTNYARRSTGKDDYTSGNQRGHGPYGGTIYITGSASASITDCTFLGGWNNAWDATYTDHNWGGLMAFRGSHVAMARCAILGAGWSGYTSGGTFSYSSGSISLCGGSLHMTNVLHGAAYSGPALANYAYDTNSGGVIEAVNCTFAGGEGHGSQRKQAYVQTSGSATFRGCIFWNNAGGDYYVGAGDNPSFDYCYLESEQPGDGNAVADPLFGDATYFHPVSRAGRYDGGFFDGGRWVGTDTADSPTIDAGDPRAPVGDEPMPNLGRVNIGYDAGTATASKSVCDSEPFVTGDHVQIFAYRAKDVNAEGATLEADVASAAGGADPSVTLVWDSADRGTNAVSDWANAVPLGEHAEWDTASHRLSIPSGTVFYRFVAANGVGTGWSDPVRSFTLGTPPVLSYGEGDNLSHRYRHSVRVHATLVSDGGMDTVVRVVYWPTNAPASVATNYVAGGAFCAPGDLFVNFLGLEADSAFGYYIEAENGMGTHRLENRIFSPLPSSERMRLHVATEAAGLADGSSWDNAIGSLQLALDTTLLAGDEILMRSGRYETRTAFILASHPGLAIRGGFSGIGDERAGETVIARDTSASQTRLLLATASAVLFDSLTFTDARFTSSATSYGQAVALVSACDATFTNCVFAGNGNFDNSSNATLYGGALGAQNGSLAVFDCVFTNNSIHGGGGNVYPNGGAIGVSGTALRVRGSTFGNNWIQMVHARNGGGGAIAALSCPAVEIDHCTFMTNYARRATGNGNYTSGDQRWAGPYGGTVYFSGCASATISDCSFLGGWNNAWDGTYTDHNWGGLMAFRGSHVAMVRCAILGAGWSGYTSGNCYNYSSGSISLCGGSLHMTNVLHGAAYSGPALANYAYDTNSGGVIEAVNCTFAGGQGHGSQRKQAYVETSGTATFRNCIFWGNAGGAKYIADGCAAPAMNYVDTQDAEDANPADRVISTDPLFVAPASLDYHLGKRSPCRNAGDRTGFTREDIDLDHGKRVRGGAIDLGCYEIQASDGTVLSLR
ncbi:MAG: hypothetical protein IJQ73_15910 [Kiritimatiellae bacterium]|nr:hypothetical protein [Kiritimatiellia bacterium]